MFVIAFCWLGCFVGLGDLCMLLGLLLLLFVWVVGCVCFDLVI